MFLSEGKESVERERLKNQREARNEEKICPGKFFLPHQPGHTMALEKKGLFL